MAAIMSKLATDGIDVNATIVKKYRTDGNKRFFTYDFSLKKQQTYSNTISPSMAQWNSLEEGDSIAVVYLAEDPDISSTKAMIEKLRAAMPKTS